MTHDPREQLMMALRMHTVIAARTARRLAVQLRTQPGVTATQALLTLANALEEGFENAARNLEAVKEVEVAEDTR